MTANDSDYPRPGSHSWFLRVSLKTWTPRVFPLHHRVTRPVLWRGVGSQNKRAQSNLGAIGAANVRFHRALLVEGDIHSDSAKKRERGIEGGWDEKA